jgi:hypothetical protein
LGDTSYHHLYPAFLVVRPSSHLVALVLYT